MPDLGAGAGRGGTSGGFGRLLVAVYAVFAVSASARAGVQIATELTAAPLAYLLSGFAAAVYVVATVALARGGHHGRPVATVAIGIEMLGVLVVGAVSVVRPEMFPQATVWSGFGAGYGYVPLVLPAVGLGWLWWTARRAGSEEHAASST